MEYTGSKYEGKTEDGRFVGEGEYTYPDGTRYVGGFKNGEFHGKGTLYFENGAYHAEWDEGKEVSGEYVFGDGLKYSRHDWPYCTPKDRRFFTEINNGIKPAGEMQLTNEDQPLEMPEGCFNAGDGYYNPTTHAVHKFGSGEEIRRVDEEEAKWITEKCLQSRPGTSSY
mmetsp:Transcript_4690/g.6446  ORF Transcript_4690/g.6446 Transcript_4690/m.6446 type:complete len:169 (-) Transcript_4690:336-842(-)|eukprot:CAMPEP_0117754684 /NCGR_PEP_ID=MMETSP0947-20121206/12967_1 /TAXON_ID=44440 /ORGANISM="Chattonella subsalsa, Strain CCMP2191" /LENGTH=168 /DNA_ID=CAMNT_0005573803 /DNA_START=156 /DNA_END=662 /DNA_ORIENTATION=+